VTTLLSPNRRAASNVVPHNTPNFETVSAAQIGQGAKITSVRTVKTISSSMCVSLSTTNPLGIKDEIRQLDGMMLILLEKYQATRKHHRM